MSDTPQKPPLGGENMYAYVSEVVVPYARERITRQAISKAKKQLKKGDVDKAVATIEQAAEKLHRLEGPRG